MALSPSPTAPSADHAWQERSVAALPTLIHHLRQDEQQIVIGHFYDERSIAELAHGLASDPGQVAILLQTALATLRRQLTD